MSKSETEFEAALARVRALGLPTATLHEAAGRTGALPSAIKPVDPTMRLAGPAVTVSSPAGDNLGIHQAIYQAQPGDVLVVDVNAGIELGVEYGYWGEIMTVAAQARQLGGLLINGGVRDRDRLIELGFPVFSDGICIRGTIKDPNAARSFNEPVLLGDVTVHPGDLIVGDADGVVAIDRDALAATVGAAIAREDKETTMMEALRQGARTLDLI